MKNGNNNTSTTTISTPLKNRGEIDPTNDELAREAERIDAARGAQQAEDPVHQVIDSEMPGGGDGDAIAERQPQADPAIEYALKFLVSTTVKLLHVKAGWTLPDEEWKTQVAHLGALVIDRYCPDLLTSQGEVVALVLVLCPYVIENVASAKKRSDSDSGKSGSGENTFVESPREDELTRAAHPS